MPAYLFIYGTLLTGTRSRIVNAIITRHTRILGRGHIQGRLYDLGDYPGAILSGDPRDRVYGRVVALTRPHITLPVFDRYEDCVPAHPERSEFIRLALPVTLCASGTRQTCWVYIYRGRQKRRRRIPAGDYRAPRT